jgi:hypothetical protein
MDAGMDPAPERSKRSSWSTFLRAHWGAIAAMDFFTVDGLTLGGLVRHHVLFVTDLATRRVEIRGITADSDGAWMQQMARNLTDAVDGFLLKHRHLIHGSRTDLHTQLSAAVVCSVFGSGRGCTKPTPSRPRRQMSRQATPRACPS